MCIVLNKKATFNFQVLAQHFDKDVCDAKIMTKLEYSHCNCNNYTELFAMVDSCALKCPEGSHAKNDNSSCCTINCQFLDTFMVVDKTINKTVLAKFFGHVDDPKISDNIEECKAMGDFF